MDVAVDDFPIFSIDIDDWTPPNCRYADVSDLFNAVSFTAFAIRSCKKNFNCFIAHFSNILSYFSCIIFTETWLTSDLDNTFNIPGFYSRNLYRDHYGGGIKLYLKDDIQSRLLSDFTFIDDLFEALSVELLFGGHKAVLTTVYHPPTPSIALNNAFIDSFTLHLRRFTQSNIPIIVAGDLNVNLLNPLNFAYVDSFITNMLGLGLLPIITTPTKFNLSNRITRFSILDQIWVSQCIVNQESFVLPLDITHHFPVVAILRFPFNVVSNVKNYVCRHFNEQGKFTFSLLISNLDVNEFIGDFNLIFNQFYTSVFKFYEIAFPTLLRRRKPGEVGSWMTPRLKQCIRKKSKLYKLFLKGRISRGDYTFYKNRLSNVIRKVKRLYYSKLLLDASKDSKMFWNCFNGLTQRAVCQSLKEVRVGDAILVGQDLVNYVNNYFITVVSSITRHLPPPPAYIFYDPSYTKFLLFLPGFCSGGNEDN